MRINIIYFSQTGNTRKVGKTMAGTFKQAGHEVRTASFKKSTPADFTSPDLVGIGAPCFESQAPSNVKEFLWGLPSLTGKKAFVFATSGGAPGKVLYDLAKPLMTKGGHVLGGFLSRGTCYYPIPCLKGRFPDRPNPQDLHQAEQFARSILAHIAADTEGPLPGSRPDALRPGLGFYSIIGNILNDSLLRIMMPKPKINAENCSQCNWCAAECPTGSIRLDPLPVIGNTCYRCYRCMTGCPEQAMSVAWGVSNFMVWTLYNQTLEYWLGDIQRGERIY